MKNYELLKLHAVTTCAFIAVFICNASMTICGLFYTCNALFSMAWAFAASAAILAAANILFGAMLDSINDELDNRRIKLQTIDRAFRAVSELL